MGWTTSSNNMNYSPPQTPVYTIVLSDNDIIMLIRYYTI